MLPSGSEQIICTCIVSSSHDQVSLLLLNSTITIGIIFQVHDLAKYDRLTKQRGVCHEVRFHFCGLGHIKLCTNLFFILFQGHDLAQYYRLTKQRGIHQKVRVHFGSQLEAY